MGVTPISPGKVDLKCQRPRREPEQKPEQLPRSQIPARPRPPSPKTNLQPASLTQSPTPCAISAAWPTTRQPRRSDAALHGRANSGRQLPLKPRLVVFQYAANEIHKGPHPGSSAHIRVDKNPKAQTIWGIRFPVDTADRRISIGPITG